MPDSHDFQLTDDKLLMDRFFEKTNKVQETSVFSSDKYLYLDDTANGQGVQSNVIFDTLSLKSELIDQESMYFVIPLTLTSTGAGAGQGYSLDPATCGLAPRPSTLSLVNAITITTGSGQQLIQDTNIDVYNNFLLVNDYSVNYMQVMAPEICYAQDADTTSFNTGMQIRSAYMLNQCKLGLAGGAPKDPGTYLEWNAVIPARMLHSYFKESGVSINTHLKINLGLNFRNHTNLIPNGFAPFNIDSTKTVYPTISIGNSSLTACRLYYRSLALNAEQAGKLADKVNNGFSKHVWFKQIDIAPFSAGTDTVHNVQVSKLVSSSTVLPERLIVYTPTATALASPTKSFYDSSALCNNIQVKINNTSYLDQPLINDYEIWQEYLKTSPNYGFNKPQEGSQINYANWLGPSVGANAIKYRYVVMDISKLENRIRSPNDAVTIQFSATDLSAADHEYRYYVEKLQCLEIKYKGSQVAYSVSTNL